MTARRVPLPASEFISGPADRVLAKLWSPAARLLVALQEEIAVFASPSWMVRDRIWIAGGCLRAVHEGVVPRDIDFFCDGPGAHAAAVRYVQAHFDHQVVGDNPLVTKLNVEFQPIGEVGSVFGSQRSWTSVDFVKRYAASPLGTARAMDFVCCAAALSTAFYARHLRFEEECRSKVLTVCAPWRPRSSVRRAQRFVERGWSISDEQRARLQALADDVKLPEWDFANEGNLPEGCGWDYG